MNSSKVTKSGMELPILTFGSIKIVSPTRVDYSMKVDGCEKKWKPAYVQKLVHFLKLSIFFTRSSCSKARKSLRRLAHSFLKFQISE